MSIPDRSWQEDAACRQAAAAGAQWWLHQAHDLGLFDLDTGETA